MRAVSPGTAGALVFGRAPQQATLVPMSPSLEVLVQGLARPLPDVNSRPDASNHLVEMIDRTSRLRLMRLHEKDALLFREFLDP